MSIELFHTSKGSRYILHGNGTWTRHSYRGEIVKDFVYYGSINWQKNGAWAGMDADRGNHQVLTDQLLFDAEVPGFTRSFVEGYVPLGFRCAPGEVKYEAGKFRGPARLDFHYGDLITEVIRRDIAEDGIWEHIFD